MSKQTSDATSDDEFEDALSDVASPVPAASTIETKSNDENLEERINRQMDLTSDDKEDGDQQATATETTDKVDAENENSAAEYLEEDMDEDELREAEKLMTPEQLQENKEKADKMKLEGNAEFKNGEAEEAIIIYTEALKICPTTHSKERAVLYGNRAAAKIKLDAKKSAIDDCSMAIRLWPDYVRVRIRRAKLYELEDKLDLALADYKHVNEIDPGEPDSREACVRLPPIVNERNEKLKEEMMSSLKDIGNLILKPFGLSTSNFQMQQDPNSGSYSINFKQNSNSS